MQERKREMAQEAVRWREAESERQTQEVLEAFYRGDRGREAERAQVCILLYLMFPARIFTSSVRLS